MDIKGLINEELIQQLARNNKFESKLIKQLKIAYVALKEIAKGHGCDDDCDTAKKALKEMNNVT